jgi:hypothetical protein
MLRWLSEYLLGLGVLVFFLVAWLNILRYPRPRELEDRFGGLLDRERSDPLALAIWDFFAGTKRKGLVVSRPKEVTRGSLHLLDRLYPGYLTTGRAREFFSSSGLGTVLPPGWEVKATEGREGLRVTVRTKEGGVLEASFSPPPGEGFLALYDFCRAFLQAAGEDFLAALRKLPSEPGLTLLAGSPNPR